MHEMGLASRRPFRKCARVVGEVCKQELVFIISFWGIQIALYVFIVSAALHCQF